MCIVDGLETKEDDDQLPSRESLEKFVAVVLKFLHYLERCRGKQLVYRVMEYGKMTNELRQVYEGIAALFELFDVVMVNWSEQWGHDVRVQRDVLIASAEDSEVLLRDLQSPRARTDALLTLKFELVERLKQYDWGMVQCLKSMLVTIDQALKINARASLPWYIPSYDVKIQSKPFGCGQFGSVHRGVWGSETNVVVKRLFIDDMAIDERVRRQVEKELSLLHQLEHPNIIKMLEASHVSAPPFVVYEDAIDGNLGVFLARSDDNKKSMWKLLL